LTDQDLYIEPLAKHNETPFDLLKLADPSQAQIETYLKTGLCFIAKLATKIVGVVVLNKVDSSTVEIKNIAVSESQQGKGYGKALLSFAEQKSREMGYKNLIIGTGNSSIGQLALYQTEGFEIDRIEKDFFIKHYEKPIFENEIQCKHMIILKKKLKK